MADKPTSRDSGELREQLALLWMRAQPSVSAFIRSLIPDYHLAQDVLQQTAVTVFRKFEEYDDARPFVAWAIGIARIEVLRIRHAESKRAAVFTAEQVDRIAAAFERVSPKVAPMHEALDDCVEKLSGRNRELVDMKYRDRMSIDGIGERVSMTPGAVKVALHRVRQALRECIRGRLAEGGVA